jgi:hypothetical protein
LTDCRVDHFEHLADQVHLQRVGEAELAVDLLFQFDE